jgi:hypothetical protein
MIVGDCNIKDCKSLGIGGYNRVTRSLRCQTVQTAIAKVSIERVHPSYQG